MQITFIKIIGLNSYMTFISGCFRKSNISQMTHALIKSWLSISVIHKYLVISPCLFLPLFVSYAKYDLIMITIEGKKMPNQNSIRVNRMMNNFCNVSQLYEWNRKYEKRTRFTRCVRENRDTRHGQCSDIFVLWVKFPILLWQGTLNLYLW